MQRCENNKYCLRPATMEDAGLLYDWRNDEDSRRYSFNKGIIKYEDHLNWLRSKLESEDTLLFIFMDEEGEAGQIRYDICEGTALLSYSIDKRCRKRGYAGIMLGMGEEELRKRFKTILIKAEVLAENIPSIKVFEKLGYEKKTDENCLTFYKKYKDNRNLI